jgi:two-component system phosphate regulon sensor histidine kinase PhoR
MTLPDRVHLAEIHVGLGGGALDDAQCPDNRGRLLFPADLEIAERALRLCAPGAYPERAVLSARIRSPAILDLVARVVARGIPESVEHAERVPSERWHEVRAAPVDARSDSGRRLFVLTFRDLTEARRMDRMRTDFVANASHELRTPLASLMGFIETMQGPARADEAARTRFLASCLSRPSAWPV